MTFDLHQILASKRAFRDALASRSIEEKLAMLDELRARAITLRQAREEAARRQVSERVEGLIDSLNNKSGLK